MLKTVKMATTDLDIGMYISRLDRPWLETPFVTQGFIIRSQEELARVREYCEFVYIDNRRSARNAELLKQEALQRRESSVETKKAVERPRVPIEKIFEGRVMKSYQDGSAWEEEHPRAQQALNTLVGDIDQIFSEVVDGDKLNIVKLRKSVEPVVDSISSNPDACVWVARLKQHDKYTYQHSLGAAIWSVSVGRHLGLQRQDLRSLAMGCMLMDVGKLRLDSILLQADRELTTEEMAQVASHVDHGMEILEECGIINQDVIDIVAHHHERYDGSGYPNGISHGQIPPFACIAGIVDTYDAITSNRSYAATVSPTEAIKLLYNLRDQDFQAELVEAFIQAIGIYPAGTLVELSSGEVGVVVAEYRTRRLRPKIMLLLDARKKKLRTARIVDLQEESVNASLSITRSLEPEAYDIDLSEIAI
jgi:HD-GYP domain-containing protein (c-di-GMP phosphodiesterase class II)